MLSLLLLPLAGAGRAVRDALQHRAADVSVRRDSVALLDECVEDCACNSMIFRQRLGVFLRKFCAS